MIGKIIIILLLIFIVSFYLAYKSLSELEVPKEVIEGIKKGKKPPAFWGVIIFLKGDKTIHYSSSSASPSVESSAGRSKSDLTEVSSSINSVNKSGRIDE